MRIALALLAAAAAAVSVQASVPKPILACPITPLPDPACCNPAVPYCGLDMHSLYRVIKPLR